MGTFQLNKMYPIIPSTHTHTHVNFKLYKPSYLFDSLNCTQECGQQRWQRRRMMVLQQNTVNNANII